MSALASRTSVLLINVHKKLHPLTVDVFHFLFSKHGLGEYVRLV